MKKIIQFFKNFSALRKNRRNKKAMGSTFIIKDETSVLDVDLLDKQAEKKDKKKVRQYTKVLVTCLSIAAVIWITYSYVLATIALITCQNADPLSELSQQVCVTVLGVVVSYCLKAFFESYAQAKNELQHEQLHSEIISSSEENTEEIYG